MEERKLKYLLIAGLFFLLSDLVTGQGIKGVVTNQSGDPVPFASIYLKEIQEGTSTNLNGEFEIRLKNGKYTLLIRSLGFESITRQISVKDTFLILNPTLVPQKYRINGEYTRTGIKLGFRFN